jgi:hypothetical protein
MPGDGDGRKIDLLPVSHVGDALLALHRAKAVRDELLESWLPPQLAETAKNPIPDIGDALFTLALGHVKQINSAMKLGRKFGSQLAKGPFPGMRPQAISLPLVGHAAGSAAGRTQIKNRLARTVLPSLRWSPFRTRDGLHVREDNGGIEIKFEPDRPLEPGEQCVLAMNVKLTDQFFAPGNWYFCELEAISQEETLSRIFVSLQVLA